MKNEIIRSLASCSGHTGIAGGQELDLKFENKKNLTKLLICKRKRQVNYLIFAYLQWEL